MPNGQNGQNGQGETEQQRRARLGLTSFGDIPLSQQLSQPQTALAYQYGWAPTREVTQQYGRPEYARAVADWERGYGTYTQMMREGPSALQAAMGYYAPGGGYGAGQRMEAAETVRGGVAQDIGSMVASGMSSQFGARGVQTRAGSELSKLYKNIEDTRAGLQLQAAQSYAQDYAQMMSTMAAMQQARPTYGQYVKPVTTQEYGRVLTGAKPYTYMT